MGNLADALRSLVKGEVDDSEEARDAASRDASLFRVRPEVVVRPKDTVDVQALVQFATQKKKAGESISITPRAAGTDMSGGPLGESIVLDVTAHLNRFIEMADLGGRPFAVVEPGLYFRDFDKETKKKDLELPSYPASREICTVGGMVANNSGGEKNLKYGKTARYVEEIEMVMADGEVHNVKRIANDELRMKLEEKSFEGEVYRSVSKLLQENKDVIEKAKPIVTKNSSGYALWDVGDGKNSIDLTKILVGSQGSLGVFTKIKFSLVHPKPYSSMAVMFLKDLNDLGTVIPEVLAHEPDSFESYDDHTFEIAVKYFPEFALQMKTGIIGLGISFLPEVWMVMTGGVPKLVLLAEFREETQEGALEKAETLIKEMKAVLPHMKTSLARNEKETRKYWAVRRESFNLLRKKIRGMRTAPFIDDFVVPPQRLPEFLSRLTEILSHYDLTYTVAGHVGDGNFHIIPLIDPKRPGMTQTISELSGKVYDLVLLYHGSISGEHNDGLIRTPYVKQMFGPDMFALFEKVEKIFDPDGIFNPGKKVGTTLRQSIEHLDLPH